MGKLKLTMVDARDECVDVSPLALATKNPIRRIVDNLAVACNPDVQPVLQLSIGDPALYGNLAPAAQVVAAVRSVLDSYAGECAAGEPDSSFAMGSSPHGYPPAIGTERARSAVAAHANRHLLAAGLLSGATEYSSADVIISSGCSGALDMAIGVLGSARRPVLVPRPGFPLYRTLCDARGIPCVEYALDGASDWDVDVPGLEEILARLSAEGTPAAAVVVTNPSNPCGSVYSSAHLSTVKAAVGRHGAAIIADEVYEDMVWAGATYAPLAAVEPLRVPVITCSGTAKRFLVPGWRLGWLLIGRGCGSRLSNVRAALADVACVLLGAGSLVQTALPQILEAVPPAVHAAVNASIAASAAALHAALAEASCSGLSVSMSAPRGAMYVLLGFPPGAFDFADDVEAARLLISEESVKVLPGTIFGVPHHVRIVLSPPPHVVAVAAARIVRFLCRHRISTA